MNTNPFPHTNKSAADDLKKHLDKKYGISIFINECRTYCSESKSDSSLARVSLFPDTDNCWHLRRRQLLKTVLSIPNNLCLRYFQDRTQKNIKSGKNLQLCHVSYYTNFYDGSSA